LLQHVTPVFKHQQIDNIIALFYVVNVSKVLLLFVDAFGELTDKIMQFIRDVCFCYSILSILCKLQSNTPNGCQDNRKFTAGVF